VTTTTQDIRVLTAAEDVAAITEFILTAGEAEPGQPHVAAL
jgi:hypothetical protein